MLQDSFGALSMEHARIYTNPKIQLKTILEDKISSFKAVCLSLISRLSVNSVLPPAIFNILLKTKIGSLIKRLLMVDRIYCLRSLCV